MDGDPTELAEIHSHLRDKFSQQGQVIDYTVSATSDKVASVVI